MLFSRNKTIRASLTILGLTAGLFFAPPASALKTFREIASTAWGYTYAGGVSDVTSKTVAASRPDSAKLQGSSVFNVKYTNFPLWAKRDVQTAIDVWAANFSSDTPISVEASWTRSSGGILGSARPGNFFSAFEGAPDSSLWYASALANALAGKDLDPDNPEIVIQANSAANWDQRNDGTPTTSEYDLESVFIHEIAHGLGFLSTDQYDSYFRWGILEQPTIFDAYLQTGDGHRVSDIESPSLELGKALTSTLVWSGPLGIQENGGVKPRLYTPSQYESGSSVSHLDEATFSSTGQNSVMTPSLDAGEIFHDPGPLLVAMLNDLRNKPPVGVVTDVPQPPRNALALVGDRSAIVTFDAPGNVRIAQVIDYTVTNNLTKESFQSLTSPVVITGLKNGTSYDFSVTSRNLLGSSPAISTNSVIPVAAWKALNLDAGADGNHIATTNFNGQPAIVYTDSKSGDVKLALWTGKKWERLIVDGRGGSSGRTSDDVSGPVSVCVSGSGKKQTLHLFYTDLTKKDLRYAFYNLKKFAYSTVDGDGPTVQAYDQVSRVRTASDVSISNACASTAAGIQVFYRDESQGVLLGAHKVPRGKWAYELIDGDRKTDARTTGDVAMKIRAVAVGSKVTILYTSVLSMTAHKLVTSGEMRLATRDGITPRWKYQTIDSPTQTMAVTGYEIALDKTSNGIIASWLSATRLSLQKPSQIRWANVDAPALINSMPTASFGTLGGPLSYDGKSLLFGCEQRICSISLDSDITKRTLNLVSNSRSDQDNESYWLTINKVRYVVASVDGKLTLLKP